MNENELITLIEDYLGDIDLFSKLRVEKVVCKPDSQMLVWRVSSRYNSEGDSLKISYDQCLKHIYFSLERSKISYGERRCVMGFSLKSLLNMHFEDNGVSIELEHGDFIVIYLRP